MRRKKRDPSLTLLPAAVATVGTAALLLLLSAAVTSGYLSNYEGDFLSQPTVDQILERRRSERDQAARARELEEEEEEDAKEDVAVVDLDVAGGVSDGGGEVLLHRRKRQSRRRGGSRRKSGRKEKKSKYCFDKTVQNLHLRSKKGGGGGGRRGGNRGKDKSTSGGGAGGGGGGSSIGLVFPDISFRDMASVVSEAGRAIDTRFEQLEPRIYESEARQAPRSPEWFNSASSRIKVLAKNISRVALVAEEATKYLAKQYNLTHDEITFGLPLADVRGTRLGDECPIRVDYPCQPGKYRAYNGYCNNVQVGDN